MSISANAQKFFLSLGITPEEVTDIKTLFEKKKPEPNKLAVVTILNKFIEKANHVTLRDGVWILEDKPPDGKDPSIRVYATPEKEETEKSVRMGTDSNTELDISLNPTQTETLSQPRTQTQTQKDNGGPKNTQECLHLRRGFCKFGRTGRIKDDSGLTCPYYHPKRMCQPYFKAGRSYGGCQNKECKNMHPLICRD